MGEGDAVAEKLVPLTNGKVEADKKANAEGKTEAVKHKKGKQHDGVTEMKEDKQDEEKLEDQKMDVDKEEANGEKTEGSKVAKEEGTGEGKKEEGTKADEEKLETVLEDGEKEEVKSEKMEEEAEEETTKGTGEKVEEDDGAKEEEDKPEELKEVKGSKKRPRSKTSAGKRDRTKKKEPTEEEKEQITPNPRKTKEPKTSVQKKENEPKTPSAFAIERPVRERKSVERLVATIEKDASKEFRIEKGRGTALKDIPNVAYKLSRKKTEDTFKLLYIILFGRRGKIYLIEKWFELHPVHHHIMVFWMKHFLSMEEIKAAQVKNNISRFSGFVWHDNEEKQMNRVKEKLDKYVKEKLIEFCDVLDIPISKANAKKEDIIAKLMEFLMEPHATTSDLLAEKEQGMKRKRTSKSTPGSSTPSKGSVKSRKKAESDSKKGGEAKSTLPESEDESDEDKEDDMNDARERSEEMSEQAASEEKRSESEEESEEDKGKQKSGSAKSSIKKGSSEKTKTKKVMISKKTIPPAKKLPAKSPDSSKSNNGSSAKKSSVKKKDEPVKKKDAAVKKDEAVKKSTPKKSLSSESLGKKVLKVKQKPKEETLEPSDEELRNSTCKILKEVDFNTATFTDILKLLAEEFKTDLTSRKSTVKLMIQEELTKLADADVDEADEEDEGNSKKDEKMPSNVGVKA